jgi:phosphoribosylformylglycinamidine cyclo-ligase
VRSGRIKALAHITGGGLTENVPRVLPDTVTAEIDAKNWALPPVFGWLMKSGGVAPQEMARTFNCGIGMVAVAAAADADAVTAELTAAGETVHRIGRIVARQADMAGTVVLGTQSWGV